jgi:dynein intermediate chain 1
VFKEEGVEDYKETDHSTEARPAAVTQTTETETGDEEQKKEFGGIKDQFNYSERASQTVNNPYRVQLLTQEKSSNTDPPPQRTCSFTVSQWSIFDAYLEDLQQKEKLAKEKTKVCRLT